MGEAQEQCTKQKMELWPFEDPAAHEGDDVTQLALFREVRDEVEQQIRIWLEEQ